MSSTSDLDEQESSNPALSRQQEAPAPRRPFSVVSATTRAAATVAVRTVGLGALRLVLGAGGFFVERGLGLLAHPWEPWRYLVYVLLLVYMAAGAFGLGAAGLWRGLGRAAMDLVLQHRLAQYILGRVLDKAAGLAASPATPDFLHRPLPLQAVRELLGRALHAYAVGDDNEKGVRGLSRAVLRRLKRWVCQLMELRLNELIGEQTRDASGVQLTLGRLRELAETQLDGRVVKALNTARNKHALLYGVIFVGAMTLAPLVLRLLR